MERGIRKELLRKKSVVEYTQDKDKDKGYHKTK
jgi:hypothetical protein